MSPALFQTALHASVALCVLGLAWRVSTWFRLRIGPDAQQVTSSQRLVALGRGTVAALAGRRMFQLLGAFFLDVLLQRRLYAQAKLRWFGHLLIFVGFTLLLLMHALAPVVTGKLFTGYQPMLDPYIFLRNLFGAMVLGGVALLLVGRRQRRMGLPQVRRRVDAAFMALLGFVLVTGFLLEAHKIASPRAYYRMAGQFIGSTNPEELKPLRALWASEFGVAFDDMSGPIDPDLVEKGRELHGSVCASCHAGPASAFVSYSFARALAPVTATLDTMRADLWLLYLHVYACFIGLASLPFTRFFHVIADPVSLLLDAAAPKAGLVGQTFSIEGRAVRRALALDACVRCGICDTHCAVGPLARYLGNPGLLPSHKLAATSAHARGQLLRSRRKDDGHWDEALSAAEGAFLCTDCGRCTSHCPVGLDLADLWQAARGDLAVAGFPAPAQWVQARGAFAWAELLEPHCAQHTHSLCAADSPSAPLSSDLRSFSRCVQCQTCTNVCPVVAHGTDSAYGVELTPQKVMNLLRLGLRDFTLGSRMVWDCATCYQCQENCPEGVRVMDILCELRALAVRRLGAVRSLRETA